ncbi:MAG TPA: AzlC family ABC transporter permease [Anaerolineae bacterium]|nr:AzlC family ABC transporter permease [Anaerolineae bacterium]
MRIPTPPISKPSSPLHEFLTGARDQLPLLIGVAPFGMIFGALALTAGIPPLEAQGFSLFVFAGSAQFIATGLITDGVPPMIVVLTIMVVNLRHLLYSATFSSYFQHLPARWKAALAWLLTDEAFVVASIRYQRSDTVLAHWYTFGTGLALWVAWQLSTAIGILLGAYIPANWSLDFALPLTFMALITPTLSDRPAWAAALTAGVLAVVLAGLPYKLGLLLAASLGIGVGLMMEVSRSFKTGMAERNG